MKAKDARVAALIEEIDRAADAPLPGRCHVLPDVPPDRMIPILADEDWTCIAFVGAKGMPNVAVAKRLAAAWNATLELPTGALEAGVVDELISCVRTLRRVLLVAHGAMTVDSLHRVVGSNAWHVAIEAANDVLAKVDGKEQEQ